MNEYFELCLKKYEVHHTNFTGIETQHSEVKTSQYRTLNQSQHEHEQYFSCVRAYISLNENTLRTPSVLCKDDKIKCLISFRSNSSVQFYMYEMFMSTRKIKITKSKF